MRLAYKFTVLGFNAWNRFLNEIHSTGHLTSNQVQNSGVAVLSETLIFDESISLPASINRRFRILLSQTQPYQQRYLSFLEDVAANSEDAIQRLTQCDRYLSEDFEYEAREDLARAQNCVSPT